MMSNMNVSTSFADRKTDVPSHGADLDKTKGQTLNFRRHKDIDKLSRKLQRELIALAFGLANQRI